MTRKVKKYLDMLSRSPIKKRVFKNGQLSIRRYVHDMEVNYLSERIVKNIVKNNWAVEKPNGERNTVIEITEDGLYALRGN